MEKTITDKIRLLKEKVGTAMLADKTGVRAHETIRRWIRAESHPAYERKIIIDKLYKQYINK
tara:strand:+ start:1893 stop:2078 length:186 start_codon:yes stop_codon:yes gene_type:complete